MIPTIWNTERYSNAIQNWTSIQILFEYQTSAQMAKAFENLTCKCSVFRYFWLPGNWISLYTLYCEKTFEFNSLGTELICLLKIVWIWISLVALCPRQITMVINSSGQEEFGFIFVLFLFFNETRKITTQFLQACSKIDL